MSEFFTCPDCGLTTKRGTHPQSECPAWERVKSSAYLNPTDRWPSYMQGQSTVTSAHNFQPAPPEQSASGQKSFCDKCDLCNQDTCRQHLKKCQCKLG